MLNIKNDNEHEETCRVMVRSLDNLIDVQEYSIKANENFAKNKRSLGIGVSNLSAWLASKGLNQNSPEAPQLISDFMEKQQYFLLKASCELAKERGAAPDFWKESKYALGLMPTDMYNKNVDEFLTPSKLDWAGLKADIAKYGLRNMTLSAIMPVESSSVTQGSTNSVEPITALVTKKTSTTKTCVVVAPNAKKWKKIYLKKEDIKNDNSGLIKCGAAFVKWLDMAMSFNLYYDSTQFEDGNLPLSLVVKDHLTATKYGMKTFYYLNSKKKKDATGEKQAEEGVTDCVGGCAL